MSDNNSADNRFSAHKDLLLELCIDTSNPIYSGIISAYIKHNRSSPYLKYLIQVIENLLNRKHISNDLILYILLNTHSPVSSLTSYVELLPTPYSTDTELHDILYRYRKEHIKNLSIYILYGVIGFVLGSII